MPTLEVKPSIRRSIDLATDLNAFVSWYSSMGERTAIGIVDEALRAWYAVHKDDYPNGPTVTSKPVDSPDLSVDPNKKVRKGRDV